MLLSSASFTLSIYALCYGDDAFAAVPVAFMCIIMIIAFVLNIVVRGKNMRMLYSNGMGFGYYTIVAIICLFIVITLLIIILLCRML